MLEFNALWFFVLLLNFLTLLFILNAILFRPLVKLFKERDDSTRGALDSAKEMHLRREELQSQMARELHEARNRSKEIFERTRNEGLSKQKVTLEGANAQAVDLIEKARRELRAEAEKARGTLRSDVERFSDDIVRKLVGV